MDTPDTFDKALQVYNAEVRKSIRAQEQRLQQLQTAHEQLQETIDTVQELPLKLQHEVMVPLGKHAFFPGQLTHTNELIVHLGDQYYVETTAAAARGILQRKLAVIAEGVQKAEKQLRSLQARLEVTQSSLGEDNGTQDTVEIRSSLEESDELLASVKSTRRQQQRQPAQGTAAKHMQQQQQGLSPDDIALQARLEHLIQLEMQEEQELNQQQWQPQNQHGQQQQQQQHGSLATIEEGNEDQDNGQIVAGPLLLDAAQRLQQLETEADSDDDDDEGAGDAEEQYKRRQQQQQQQQQQQHRQHQHQQQQQPHVFLRSAATSNLAVPSAPPQAAAAAAAGNKPLKSALKKGFLAAAGPTAQPSSRKVASHSNSTTTQRRGASSPAFTGAVVERPPQLEQAAAGLTHPLASAVMERSVQRPVAASLGQGNAATGDSSIGRVSKFKLRRLGLEPPSE